MALLDFLKRKKETEKAREKKTGKKIDEKSGEVKVEKKSEGVWLPKKAEGFSYSIIKTPHISEKATDLAEKENQYVFEVLNNSNKVEIKKAVEGVYGVKVLGVNIIKIPHKKRRIGRTQGFRKAYTKAVIKLKEGDKIEIL